MVSGVISTILEMNMTVIAAINPTRTRTSTNAVAILTEIGNIIVSQILSAISNTFEERLEYSVPSYFDGPITKMMETSDSPLELAILIVDTTFQIKDLQITGDVVLFLKLGELASFVESVEKCLG